jgi:hypothetical protein
MNVSARVRHGAILGVVSFVATLAAQQTAPPRPAVPIEPIQAVVDAFSSHQLVALDDPHGNEQAHAFRLSLIRDQKFSSVVNDIVVEFGNARYQERVDRFVRGEAVADDLLRDVWQNTTVPNIGWDRPIYEELFRAVRAVNASRPRSRQLRVLLGDPPIDWDDVHSTDALMKWMGERDTYAAGVVQREVLAKGRRALIVYGGGHFFRLDARTLVSLIEKDNKTKVLTIWTNTDVDLPALDAGVAAWPVPSLSIIRDTLLGAAPFTSYVGINPNAAAQLRGHRMDDEFDALLYLGSRSTMTTAPLSRARCADAAYMNMRIERMSLLPGPPGAPNPIDQLKKYCATQSAK